MLLFSFVLLPTFCLISAYIITKTSPLPCRFGWLLVRLCVLKQYNIVTTLFIDGEGHRRHKIYYQKRKKKCEYTRFQITLIDSNDIMI